ncbi:Heterogeneous nuclear ribonucleoprotein Q [Zea mays]|uniref:Heterogeneous nuclear ribonucleoprotein Q n=1 Tax=Zea mays TaxID=4577 RepID=A0A3L6FAI6_MAIZE|nr:Heterogeneous nuclear ribonucleoprotein Q [Zea mays]
MPRRTGNAASTKSVELVKQDQMEFDHPDEVDEEEEVEYEEIEEEVEYEEVEVERRRRRRREEDDEIEGVREVDANHDSKIVDDDPKDGNEKEKHAELLALPPHGAEVYVGGLSSDVSSEDLKQLFESVGEVAEVRMRGKGDNKTYAFINFRTKEMALKAIQKLSNKDLKGKKIKVSSSQAKNRLFIGNVPHDWTPDDFKTAVEEVGPGVLKVDLMKACAEYAKQKMSTPEFKLDTNAPTVSWADHKNASEATSTSQLKKLFEHVGEITKVVIPPAKSGHENRYGFVHFKERSMVMKALKNTERYELDGQLLDCSPAKPPADKKDDTGSSPTAKGRPLPPSYAPLGYGLGELIIHLEKDWQVLTIPLETDWQVLMACFLLMPHRYMTSNLLCSRCFSRFNNDPNGPTRRAVLYTCKYFDMFY